LIEIFMAVIKSDPAGHSLDFLGPPLSRRRRGAINVDQVEEIF
jgi:hypothetical protein